METTPRKTILANRVEEYAMTPEDFMNPAYIVPMLEGEELHIGYRPNTEDVAFMYPISRVSQHIFIDNFDVNRYTMPLDQLISCVRKMVLYPTNNIVVYTESTIEWIPRTILYKTTFIVKDTSNTGEEYSANIIVCIVADLENNAYLVEVNRYSGERSVYYRFYETLRSYIQSGGRQNPSIRVHCGTFDPSRLSVFTQLDSNFD
jgi:hypothetical protein